MTSTASGIARPRTARVSLLILAVLALTAATSRGDVVRALLFFSPSCPHCHDVMERHLPPLLAKHGEGLRIVAVNVQTPDGAALYDAVARHFALRPDQQGVPALVVGGRLLMGSGEIPAELPGIVKAGLAAGGIDWPDIAGVRSFLVANALLEPEAPPVAVPEPGSPPVAAPASAPPTRPSAQESESPRSEPPVGRDDATGASRAGTDREHAEAAPPVSGSAPDASGGLVVVAPAGGDDATVWRKFGRDPIGNTVSLVVLIGMIGVVALTLRRVLGRRRSLPPAPRWVVPVLAVAGIAVAAYLSFVEVTRTEAICGPIGDCNAVQMSPYASILGIPIGILGLLGYSALGAAWLLVERAADGVRRRGSLMLWGAALAGVLFSIYLTFLEPFVIGATCVWCLNSAVIMTLMLMALTPAAVAALRKR